MAAAILLLIVAGGTLATYLWDGHETSLPTRVAAGAVIGLAVFGLVGFLLAMVLGLTGVVVWVGTLAAAAPLALLAKPARRARVAQDFALTVALLEGRPLRTAAIAATAILVAVVFAGALYVRGDGIYTADHHNLGDLPLHVGIIEGFVQGDNFPPHHPELADARLTYPFLVDFVAAELMCAGASLRLAVLAQNLLLAWALVALLVHWGRRLTGDRGAALLVPALVLLNGGLGFWLLARDALITERGVIPLLAALPHDYTILSLGEIPGVSYSLRWGNAVTTLLIPQRGFLFGLPLFILALTLLWDGVRSADERSEGERRQRMIAAGFVAGLLPLVHMHSFVVFVAAAACLALLFPGWRRWARLTWLLIPLAAAQVAWLFSGSGLAAKDFVQLHYGWERVFESALWFWIYNTGLVIPAVAVALVWRNHGWLVPRDLARFLAPFAGCFIIPNVLQLSPWLWDNIKFLYFAQVAATPVLALLVVALWRRRRCGLRAIGVALFVSLTLAGALDVTRIVTREKAQRIFDAAGMRFAQMLAQNTPPHAVVLRQMTYNHPALLAGRLAPLGWPAHIWSHGLAAGTREQDVRAVYSGASDAFERLRRLRVDYVVVGPGERAEMPVNDAFFATLPLVGEVDGYRLYRVTGR
jgi:hypothetical protein